MSDDATLAFIEIPLGSDYKYEYDETLRVFRLSWTIISSARYPVAYGFLPGTRADDGDHLDVMIMEEGVCERGTLAPVRPVGVLEVVDSGEQDQKILAVLANDARFDTIKDLGDLPDGRLREIELFFTTYKMPNEEEVSIEGWSSRERALELIQQARICPPEEDPIFAR